MSFRFFKGVPLFAPLLPLFFVLHGFAQYYYFIPLPAVGELGLRYLFYTLLLAVVFWFIYRSIVKTGVAVFLSLFLFFFFGAFHDFLKSFLAQTFFVKYIFLLPLLGVSYLLLLFAIKKKTIPGRLILYLNTLLLVLLFIDMGTLLLKASTEKERNASFSFCADCAKPDVYVIVVDGYAGKEQLEKDFSFTNALFLESLQKLGFKTLNKSRSNYVRTEFSMASMLNMEYHQLQSYAVTEESLFYCYRKIARNKTVAAFEQQGYEVVNNSIFDIQNSRSPVNNTFLITGANLIESETLPARLWRDLYIPFLMTHLRDTRFYQKFILQALESDKVLLARLEMLAKKKTDRPRFIFSHFLMTHFPYYFKVNGEFNKKEDIRTDNYHDKELYLGNLQFTNTRLLTLLHSILQTAARPPVIILVSDHGFRYSANPENAFSALGAVYFPNVHPTQYHDSLSGVNQFRVLLNNLFRQKLPLLENRNGEVPGKDQRE